MSTFVRLVFVVCTCAITPVFAGGPAPEPEQPASQSSPPAASDAAAQPAATASDKNASTSSTEKTASTQTPNATAGASSSGGATKVVLVDKTMTDAQVKQLLAKGYRPQSRDGEVFYCRREAIVGSRFEQKICKTAEQLMRDELDAKEMAERMQQPMGSPVGK